MAAVDQVLAVRSRMADLEIGRLDFGPKTPLYPDRLESAIARQSVGSQSKLKWGTIHHMGATLFFGLIANHPFENGNKRTALISLLVFLNLNKRVLVGLSQDELFELATCTANWRVSGRQADDVVFEVGSLARRHLRAGSTSYRPMKTRDLIQSLKAFGCEIEKPARSFIRIHPPAWSTEGRTVKIAYRDEGRDVPAAYVRRARQELGLTVEDGVSAESFFGLGPVIDEFVLQYRDLLWRLADA